MIIYLIANLIFYSTAFSMVKTLTLLEQIEHLKQQKKLHKANGVGHAQNKLIADEQDNGKDFDTYLLQKAHDAAHQCKLKKLEVLVTEKNVNKINHDGRPIIFSTIDRSFDKPDGPIEEILNFLIEKNADINRCAHGQKMSAFEYATRESIRNETKNLRVLEYFLNKGLSNPFFALPRKQSGFEIALQCAMDDGSELCPQAKAVLKLFQKEAKTLHHAILSFNVKKVSELANEKSVQESYEGLKPLFTAITHFTRFNRKPMLQIIKILLDKNIEPNEKIVNINTVQRIMGSQAKIFLNTYLMSATIVSIFQNNTQMIPLLLDAGADPHKSFHPDLPSAFELAHAAAYVSIEDIENQCSQGFSKEIARIVENERVAAKIVELFLEHTIKHPRTKILI
jgi:hypothetical protein